jgi:hypothetical protein
MNEEEEIMEVCQSLTCTLAVGQREEGFTSHYEGPRQNGGRYDVYHEWG